MTRIALRSGSALSRYVSLCAVAAFLSGCAVGPNYNRPKVDVPTAYRGLSGEQAAQTGPASLADQKWWEIFQDKELQGLIRTALQNNYDVRIAAARVLEARAQLGITRADQFPSLSGGGNITSQRLAASGLIPGFQQTTGQLSLSAAWNLDFWGRYRRATEAARATLLAN
jgi:multidrug efflux system outer membrane protein